MCLFVFYLNVVICFMK
uniref:Uncharacterized protein n=1 Tax=Anguilla anguilla TaxID=7936 RepID=A0A0E9S4T5_ANGAN